MTWGRVNTCYTLSWGMNIHLPAIYVQQEYMLLTHTQIQHTFEIYGSADFFNHVFVMSATPYPFIR